MNEAEIEHLISLVEDENFDPVELKGLLIDQIEQSTGRRDKNVDAARQFLAIAPDRRSAYDARHLHRCQSRVVSCGFRDLTGQFAGRREHQHPATLAGRVPVALPQPVNRRKHEGCGLARARLGDAEEVIARLVDRSLFWEVLPDRGREMIVGVGRVNGLYMGFVANRQGLIDDPTERGARKPAGILYREGIAKVAAFSRACNDDGIPICWLQDISGFDIGVEAERQGLLG